MADSGKGAAFLDANREERPKTATFMQMREGLARVYRDGWGRGDRAGWPMVDELFTVAPGQVTTITGYPNSGKSQWLDSLTLNLCRQGWRVCMCSLENLPVELHMEKLITQFVGKPIRDGLTERMSEDEMLEAATEMDEWYSFVVPTEKKPNPSLEDVMVLFEENFRARGLWQVQGAKIAAVIDPWNELEHFRRQGISLSEYVGESLSKIRQWAQMYLVHFFIVGHPAKQQRVRDTGKLPVVTPDMISDSAHFWNKSHNCITVALQDEHNSPLVDIHVQKIRWRHIGKRGVATLKFDKVTGRYSQADPSMDFKVRARA